MQRQTVSIQIDDEKLLPLYASELASGADLRAACRDMVTIDRSASALIPTGIRLEIPKGFEVQIRSRSGLALKHGIIVLNSPGTIDADFRGEIHVLLINHGKHPFIVTYGMRIAQMVLAPVFRAQFITGNTFATTDRGRGGFGHTGTH